MKVKVKRVFFDNNGLHRKGDIVSVDNFEADKMELIEEPKVEKKAKTTKK